MAAASHSSLFSYWLGSGQICVNAIRMVSESSSATCGLCEVAVGYEVYNTTTIFSTIYSQNLLFLSVRGGQRGIVQSARTLQRRFPSRYLRKRGDAKGVPHRGTHEVQERLQVQGESKDTP